MSSAVSPGVQSTTPGANVPLARPRIAVLSRNFDPKGGGAERYAVELVRHLAGQYEFHVFSQSVGPGVAASMPGVQFHAVMLVRRPRWINQLWYAIATWCATRKGFDLVHSHENTWHGQVQTVHVLPIHHNFWLGRTGVRRALRALQRASSPRLWTYFWLERTRYSPKPGRQIVAISETLKQTIAQVHPHARPMLQLLEPGVASVVVDASSEGSTQRRSAARAVLGLAEVQDGQALIWLLFVANDMARKGLPTLLQAMALLPETVHLAVVGEARQEFKSAANGLGLGRRIRWLGRLADVTGAYASSDVLVHPTLEDTFAMVVLEAMAQGLPAIVSGPAYCGISAHLRDGVEAVLLHQPTDAGQLAQAIQGLAEDVEQRRRMAVAGLRFASQYSWSSVAERQASIYARVLSR